MSAVQLGSVVRHVSGVWACGCDDEDGEVTNLSDGAELERYWPMRFYIVGTREPIEPPGPPSWVPKTPPK